jgi:hypothetical protein
MIRVALALLSFAIASFALAQAPVPAKSSGLDFSDNANRDKAIACMPGDRERHPGQTMGQLFGDAWPAQPEGAHEGAKILRYGRTHHPRGLESQHALVVVAVLVDANGKPLAAHSICSTAIGFDAAAEHSALLGTFQPATVEGKAITSVATMVISFKPAQAPIGREGG